MAFEVAGMSLDVVSIVIGAVIGYILGYMGGKKAAMQMGGM